MTSQWPTHLHNLLIFFISLSSICTHGALAFIFGNTTPVPRQLVWEMLFPISMRQQQIEQQHKPTTWFCHGVRSGCHGSWCCVCVQAWGIYNAERAIAIMSSSLTAGFYHYTTVNINLGEGKKAPLVSQINHIKTITSSIFAGDNFNATNKAQNMYKMRVVCMCVGAKW